MFVELHMLQNFAPHCLNRDDTNSPKECEFGGYRRARISSQCIKRAIRTYFSRAGLLPPEHLSCRTRAIVRELSDRLARDGKDREEASTVVRNMLQGLGLGMKDETRTQYTLFLAEQQIAALARLCAEHWDTLAAVKPAPEATQETGTGRRRKKKSKAKAAVPPELQKALAEALGQGPAVDLSLFGRMLADIPERNVDAACQVAHAISTNRVSMEMDFYTAVDDLPGEETGADMMGYVEYNSACFYRYALLDTEQLRNNLDGESGLAEAALDALLRAAIAALPTGKQNSFAAHNPPGFILAVVRDGSEPWSLANAFVNPVSPARDADLMEASIARLDDYWARLCTVYTDRGVAARPVCTVSDAHLPNLGDQQVPSVDALVARVMEVAR
jgi:CRISPR system Cascade subunit CasC